MPRVDAEAAVARRVAGGAEHVVDPRRRVLLEQEDRTPRVRHELLARARKQSPDVHARVLGGVKLARIVGDEGPRVRDLAALEVDDA